MGLPTSTSLRNDDRLEVYGVKVIIMAVLIIADLGLNSSLEYDLYAAMGGDNNLIFFGFHIFVQLGIFLTLFLMLCDTYLFKVGLLGVLFTHFRNVFCLHPVYILFTILLDGTRIRFLLQDHKPWELYQDMSFQAMSVTHKLVAALYYIANIRAIMKLTDPIFYQKEPWILLYRQCLQTHQPHSYHHHYPTPPAAAAATKMVRNVEQARRGSSSSSAVAGGPSTAAAATVTGQKVPIAAAALSSSSSATATTTTSHLSSSGFPNTRQLV